MTNNEQDILQEEQMPYAVTPTYLKYSFGIEEAAAYYGIGTKKLRQIVAEHPNGDFFLENGRHILLKRRQFENYLDNASTL